MAFLGAEWEREHELGQQPFHTHSYLFNVNSISTRVPPESRNSPLCGPVVFREGQLGS